MLLSVGYSAFAVPNTMDDVNGCTTNNPLFVNTATNDYRLQKGSPCINRGLKQDWMADAILACEHPGEIIRLLNSVP